MILTEADAKTKECRQVQPERVRETRHEIALEFHKCSASACNHWDWTQVNAIGEPIVGSKGQCGLIRPRY